MNWIEEDRGYKTPCWIWQGSINNKTGYGIYKHNGRLHSAHRFIYIKYKGTISRWSPLDHLCARVSEANRIYCRRCVNPDHLEIVTNAINNRRGKNAKITMEIAQEIRKEYDSKYDITYEYLAGKYNLNKRTIGHIICRRLWK